MYIQLVFGLLIAAASFCSANGQETITFSAKKLPAIILVPGDCGSRLDYRTIGNESWAPLWVNLDTLFSQEWKEAFSLQYNTTTHTTSDGKGYEVRVPGFGGTDEIEYLLQKKNFFTRLPYMHVLVEFLKKNLGYSAANIRGAPYDFRKAPNELGEYFAQLTELVESSRRDTGGAVILLAHSYGAPLMNYFLNTKTPAWRKTNIDRLLTLSGAWGGSKKTVSIYTAGLTGFAFFDEDVNKTKMIQAIESSFPSLSFLLPNSGFNKNETLVQIADKKYAIEDIDELFRKLNATNAILIHNDTKNLLPMTTAPGVKVDCIYTTKVKTLSSLQYNNSEDFPHNATVIEDDFGDGTVSVQSLKYCNEFSKYQSESVVAREVTNPNATHVEILKDLETLKYIGNLLAKEAQNRTLESTLKKNFELPLRSYNPENVQIIQNPLRMDELISIIYMEKQRQNNMTKEEYRREEKIWELESPHHRN